MSNFDFLKPEFPALADTAIGAEKLIHINPQATLMCARQSLETLVYWLYKYDKKLSQPYDAKLQNLLNDSTFRQIIPSYIWEKMDTLRMAGNQAVHGKNFSKIQPADAAKYISHLFLIYVWFERTYGRPDPNRPSARVYDRQLIPADSTRQTDPQKQHDLQKQQSDFEQRMAAEHNALRQREQQLLERAASLEEREKLLAELDATLAARRQEIAAAKVANSQIPDRTDYNEAQTRKLHIDLMLAEAGWSFGTNMRAEVPVDGMPNDKQEGFVDYVLDGDNGLPLALVEAKRTSVDATTGQQQAKLYADCLEKMTGQRPVIFYSNGYKTWIWDDVNGGPPRRVSGFYTPQELRRLLTRRTLSIDLRHAPINTDIAGRPYQMRAIRSMLEVFASQQRAGLLVMATGTGKTRTAAALVDALMKANRVQTVLFLADRTSLVNQAVNAFKNNLPDCATVNLVTQKQQTGRAYFCTYQTMIGLIDEMNTDSTRRFGVGAFDLVIIDEAHRSVYQKFGEIFRYFDSLLVGLTATPRAEVDRDTYQLFGLSQGVPTDHYELEQAIVDGYLVPPKAYDVPLKIVREGVKYAELSPEEKEHWESLDWGDAGAPDEVDASKINKMLFNQETVDKMLAHLMQHGITVDGGDRLGKTIIFAVNQRHADFIAERFNHHYPHYLGHFARVITHSTKYAQSLIDAFGTPAPSPQIAISVDMLDTGIDVPAVVNLVFFKAVRSKVKFLQMIGRGTRLCADLFGPGDAKTQFYIFDFCSNFEYFNQNPDGADTHPAEPIGQRLFKARLTLLEQLRNAEAPTAEERTAQEQFCLGLQADVAAMNPQNFIVRTELEHVNRFREPAAWTTLDDEALSILRTNLSRLPTEQDSERLETKLFDLLCYQLEIATLTSKPAECAGYIGRLKEIASALESQQNIPQIKAQLALLQDMQTDTYWENISVPMLEQLRRNLRDLVYLIEKTAAPIVYTVLSDTIDTQTETRLNTLSYGVDKAQYRKRVESFIKANENHLTIARLRRGLSLTSTDLSELERFVFEAQEVSGKTQFEACFGPQPSLPAFIRSLVGLDRQAVQTAFGQFLQEGRYSERQIRFVEMIIEQLTARGQLEVGQLYEAPFTHDHHEGLDGIFSDNDAAAIAQTVEAFNQSAVA